MIKILPRSDLWLLAGLVLTPARAAEIASYPSTATEGETRILVQSLELPRPRLLVSPGERDRLCVRVRREPRLAAIADWRRRDADAMPGIEPVKRELEGRRRHRVARAFGITDFAESCVLEPARDTDAVALPPPSSISPLD